MSPLRAVRDLSMTTAATDADFVRSLDVETLSGFAMGYALEQAGVRGYPVQGYNPHSLADIGTYAILLRNLLRTEHMDRVFWPGIEALASDTGGEVLSKADVEEAARVWLDVLNDCVPTDPQYGKPDIWDDVFCEAVDTAQTDGKRAEYLLLESRMLSMLPRYFRRHIGHRLAETTIAQVPREFMPFYVVGTSMFPDIPSDVVPESSQQ